MGRGVNSRLINLLREIIGCIVSSCCETRICSTLLGLIGRSCANQDRIQVSLWSLMMMSTCLDLLVLLIVRHRWRVGLLLSCLYLRRSLSFTPKHRLIRGCCWYGLLLLPFACLSNHVMILGTKILPWRSACCLGVIVWQVGIYARLFNLVTTWGSNYSTPHNHILVSCGLFVHHSSTICRVIVPILGRI